MTSFQCMSDFNKKREAGLLLRDMGITVYHGRVRGGQPIRTRVAYRLPLYVLLEDMPSCLKVKLFCLRLFETYRRTSEVGKTVSIVSNSHIMILNQALVMDIPALPFKSNTYTTLRMSRLLPYSPSS